VTTPEKWDGVSRSWQTRGYVRQVALLVIDEIHLLGEERGPVLEVIVSRAAFIAAHAGNQVRKCRVVGLSTALANAGTVKNGTQQSRSLSCNVSEGNFIMSICTADLAAWLGINTGRGLYNFRPSVRPVPLAIHIHGFPGKHYCPRMATMNKPTFQVTLS
jgi:activating signal cointegrator complex subunit 3